MLINKKRLPSVKTGHFKNTASFETEVMSVPDVVKISMSQNIGAPCAPIVKKGDYVKVGQKIGETDAFVSAPVHSSVSGSVLAIEEQRSVSGGADTLITIKTDKEQNRYDGLAIPVANNLEEFVAAVRESGLVGLGGAAFPAHIKFNPKDPVDTLIVNAAECEPYITADHRLMLEAADELLYGMTLIMKHLDLKKGYIGIEENKKDAIDHLNKLILENNITNIETFSLLSRYPKGAERVLVYEITGKNLDAGVLPASLGIVLSNVASVAFIGQYFKDGMPLINKRITVDGNAVATPKNVLVPIGTPVGDVVEYCGGYIQDPKKILLGGPMMGRAIFSDEIPTMKGTNAILAFAGKESIIPEETACINCGRCHSVCPFKLLPTGLADAYETQNVDRLKYLNVNQCMECGSCSFICPARRPLGFLNKLGKAVLKEAGGK